MIGVFLWADRAGAPDRPCNLLLTADGIHCDDGALEGQQGDELRNGDDLVALVLDLHLAKNETMGARPRRDHMDGSAPTYSANQPALMADLAVAFGDAFPPGTGQCIPGPTAASRLGRTSPGH